jgi:hypothetical protein
MCTTIAHKQVITGSGKGPQGWFVLDHAYVGYDHPTHAPFEHALSIDFVSEAAGAGARVAVELSRESARALTASLLAALDAADAYENAG